MTTLTQFDEEAILNHKTTSAILRTTFASATFLFAFQSVALDKDGNFESTQEQDAFIVTTLKQIAGEMNSQAPIQVDGDTRLMSVIALQKTLNYQMMLTRYKASQVNPKIVEEAAKENLNHTVCMSKATRDLIDVGVKYVYRYVGNDGKLITQVVIDKYRCK